MFIPEISPRSKQFTSRASQAGWHIFMGTEYRGYDTAHTLAEWRELGRSEGYRLVGITGNGLSFVP